MPRLVEHDVETLPGIGPRSGALLRERGYETVGDLLWLMPKRYDDQRHPTPIHALRDGEYAVVEGRVRSSRRFPRAGRYGLEVRLDSLEPNVDANGYQELKLVWFQTVPGLLRRFETGGVVRVAGQMREYRGVATIAHPEVLDASKPGSIQPRYAEVPGVRRKAIQRAIRAAVDRAVHEVPDLIPGDLRASQRIGDVADALRAIHAPEFSPSATTDAASKARRRLALEELLLWEVALRVRRSGEGSGRAQTFQRDPAVARACGALPFELTGAQQAAVAVLAERLGQQTPMQCLLQGDVGCGKTAVALVACAQVVGGGAQAAFLAPTELLAEQHAATLHPIAARLGLRLGVFTGALSKRERRAMLDRMATGAVDLVVGTHALLSGDIQFASLGLAVVDEQHRFGVAQRMRLGARNANARPHLLVMTATPIPRTLALVLYAGLDLVTIADKPPGRVPATTKMVPIGQRARVHRQIERALEAGGRSFVVCPAISGTDEMVGVDRTTIEMRSRFGDDAVAEIHGQLSADQRRDRMREFAQGDVRILVGTTVLEVGVDVPAANLIVVEQAERFGLAQLHQLRGRVGRAGQRSACLLTHGAALSEEAEMRLGALCETDDGFVLAETDLKIRGPGHLFGYRQSGASGLQFADLQDRQLLEQASMLADRIMSDDPDLEDPRHETLKAAVARWRRYEAIREEAG